MSAAALPLTSGATRSPPAFWIASLTAVFNPAKEKWQSCSRTRMRQRVRVTMGVCSFLRACCTLDIYCTFNAFDIVSAFQLLKPQLSLSTSIRPECTHAGHQPQARPPLQ